MPIVKAAMPKPVIAGSFVTPEALAHILTQKFVMGLPLYRQEQDWKRQGIDLSRETMSNWLLKGTEAYLVPIYDALRKRLLRRECLHTDETTLQVLKEPGKAAKSKSYMWLYRSGGDAEHATILYEYQPSREIAHVKRFLGEWKGYLHTDAYNGYHKLDPGIIVIGCRAHARRKFDEALTVLPESARKASAQWKASFSVDACLRWKSSWCSLPRSSGTNNGKSSRVRSSMNLEHGCCAECWQKRVWRSRELHARSMEIS